MIIPFKAQAKRISNFIVKLLNSYSSIIKEESEEELQMNTLPKIGNRFDSKLNDHNRKASNQHDKLEVKTTLSNTSNFTNNSSASKNAGVDPSSFQDAAYIIEKIRDPNELAKAFDNYQPRNKEIDMDELKKSERSRIKRYKDCVYFGEFINSKRHGKGKKKM